MPPIKPTVLIQVDDAAPTTTTITNHHHNSNNGDAQTSTHAYAEAGRRVRISHAKSSCKSLRSASPSAIDYAISSNGTLEMEEEVLTQDHITNTGAVVSLTEVRYSSAMRAYRVYRQGQLGDPRSAPPHFRLLTATNLLLFTAVLGMLLSFVWSLNILPHVWVLAHIMEKERAAAMLRPDAGGMGLLAFLFWIACTSVLAYRVTSTLTDTMMEEVLAVRGVGLQITRYDLWHRVRSRHFVDLLMLRSLFIHDAFYRCQTIFFLSSSVENMPTRLVFFADTLPRLEVLRPVLVGLRHVLYGEADEGKSLAELEEVMMRRTPHSPLHVAGDSLRTEDSWGDDTTAVASELDTPTKDLS